MKTKIKKCIRKYIPVICTLLFIPIFSVNTFAYTSYDNFPSKVPFDFNYVKSGVSNNGGFNLSPDSNNVYTATNSKLSGVTELSFSAYSPKSFYFPVDNDAFDYYFLGSFIGNAENISDFTFFPDSFHVRARTHQNTLEIINISDVSLYHTDSWYSKGFSVSCKLDLSVHNCIDFFVFKSSTAGSVPASLKFEFSVIALPKSFSSGDAQMAIVSAINSQTSALGEKLDGIDSGIEQGNNLIDKGNENTDDVIQDFNEVFEDFNAELENIEEFDNSIISEFESANEQYLIELNNFSLSASLLNAGNWLSTSMQTVYDNSSDYKMLWLVPLLLGIPLIILFLKKGSDDE